MFEVKIQLYITQWKTYYNYQPLIRQKTNIKNVLIYLACSFARKKYRQTCENKNEMFCFVVNLGWSIDGQNGVTRWKLFSLSLNISALNNIELLIKAKWSAFDYLSCNIRNMIQNCDMKLNFALKV